MQPVLIPVSPGELLDRASILELKIQRVLDARKRAQAEAELGNLRISGAEVLASGVLSPFLDGLRQVNAELWDAEVSLRACERQGFFGPGFVRQARSVYRLNDRRADLKRQANEACGSPLAEVKEYAGSAVV